AASRYISGRFHDRFEEVRRGSRRFEEVRMGRGVLRALIASVVLVSVLVSSANAQPSRAPRHWARGAAIRLWIDPEQMPPNGDTLVEKAMKTWTVAADGRFTLVNAWESTAPVRLHFMSADYRYGVTAPRVNPATGLIVKAEVGVAADAGRDALERQII